MRLTLLLLLAASGLLAGCADAPPPPPDGPMATAPTADDSSVGLGDAPAPTLASADLSSPAAPPPPDGFSRLADVAPGIAQEMRYTTPYNFVGAPIDGYVAPSCLLATVAAEALARVADDLAADGLGLKVYDCYRPQTAVNHFVRWARGTDDTMKPAFYPTEPRGLLFRRGYIASRSGHSRGATVDLTLVRLPAAASILSTNDYPDPADGPLPRCDRPARGGEGGRLDERDLDMGTAWDCLDWRSATASSGVSREARENRRRLVRAMARHGFRNYDQEWWHFTYRPEPFRTHFDFPVE